MNTSVNKNVTLLMILIGTRITLSLAHKLMNITYHRFEEHATFIAETRQPDKVSLVSPKHSMQLEQQAASHFHEEIVCGSV